MCVCSAFYNHFTLAHAWCCLSWNIAHCVVLAVERWWASREREGRLLSYQRQQSLFANTIYPVPRLNYFCFTHTGVFGQSSFVLHYLEAPRLGSAERLGEVHILANRKLFMSVGSAEQVEAARARHRIYILWLVRELRLLLASHATRSHTITWLPTPGSHVMFFCSSGVTHTHTRVWKISEPYCKV